MTTTNAPPMLAAVGAALREVSVAGVVVGARLVDQADIALLHARERVVVARAVLARQAQFASGRALLHHLTTDATPILPRPGQAPALPNGRPCSLAHDHQLVVAAIADGVAVAAIGIDVEPIPTDTAEWSSVVLRPDERELDAGAAFVVKEAAYKAWTCMGGGMLAHHDVRVTLDGPTATASVVAHGVTLTGRWTTVAGRYLALLHAPRSAWGRFAPVTDSNG